MKQLSIGAKIHEECGVFGIWRKDGGGVVVPAYHALYALQHRGQESCGIAVNVNGVIDCHKDVGLVNDVFTPEVLRGMKEGLAAVGHCRYATTGSHNVSNAQPLVVNHLKGGMALCHNGNLVNATELRETLEEKGAIFHTTSDTEVIAYTITQERIGAPSIEEAVSRTMDRIKGAYSIVIMSPQKVIAARDPLGFRPLCVGRIGDGGYVFASETCALNAIDAEFIRDVQPGEILIADEQGLTSIPPKESKKRSMCVFEFIYFSRPDSVIDGSSVHVARLRAGAFLALEHPVQADVVIGVPDSGIDAAIGYSRQSGIPYGMGFIKNKYIGRTFIQPEQAQRLRSVNIKLNVISSTVQGKRVVLVDDSVVRGTTSARIVKLLREAGATQVHLRLSAPPFKHPCYFGTDIDSTENLLAHNHTVEEMREIIGVDSLGFLNPSFLDKLADHPSGGFCTACFTGDYPVPPPSVTQKSRFEMPIIDQE